MALAMEETCRLVTPNSPPRFPEGSRPVREPARRHHVDPPYPGSPGHPLHPWRATGNYHTLILP